MCVLTPQVLTLGLLEETNLKVELKFCIMESGAQFVMITGRGISANGMQILYAGKSTGGNKITLFCLNCYLHLDAYVFGRVGWFVCLPVRSLCLFVRRIT